MPDDILDAAQKAINDASKTGGAPSVAASSVVPVVPLADIPSEPAPAAPAVHPDVPPSPPIPPSTPVAPTIPASPVIAPPPPPPPVETPVPPIPAPASGTPPTEPLDSTKQQMVNELLGGASVPPPPAAPEVKAAPMHDPSDSKPKKKSAKGLLLAIIATLLLTLPVGVYFISQKNNQIANIRNQAAAYPTPYSSEGFVGGFDTRNVQLNSNGYYGATQPGTANFTAAVPYTRPDGSIGTTSQIVRPGATADETKWPGSIIGTVTTYAASKTEDTAGNRQTAFTIGDKTLICRTVNGVYQGCDGNQTLGQFFADVMPCANGICPGPGCAQYGTVVDLSTSTINSSGVGNVSSSTGANIGTCKSEHDHVLNDRCTNGERCYTEVRDILCQTPIASTSTSPGNCTSCPGWAGPAAAAGRNNGYCIVQFEQIEHCAPADCSGGGSNPTPTTPRIPTNTPSIPVSTNTPSPTGIAPVCVNIKVYKGGTQVSPSTLRPGDDVVLAVKGNLTPTKAHFRINGGAWQETTTINSSGEFTLNYTIPNGVPDFVIESEVFTNGAWH